MYKLAADYGMTRCGATAAAFMFMFNGFYALHTEFLSIIACYAWLPAVIFYFRKLADSPSLKGSLIVSLVITLQFFGGHPGYSYYTILFIIAYYIWHKYDFRAFFKSANTSLYIFFAVALPVIIFTAIQSIPSFELIKQSVRDSGLEFSSSATYSINPLDFMKFCCLPLWSWFKPFYSGDVHVIGFYLSLTAIVTVLVNISKINTKERLFLAAMLILSALLALGKNFPLYSFFYYIVPGWKYFRFPAQAMFIAVLCFSLLTGFIIGDLKSTYIRILLIFLIFTELFLFNLKANRVIDSNYYAENTQNINFLLQDKTLFRVMLTPKTQSEPPENNNDYFKRWSNFKDMVYPNTGAAYGISYIDGYETIKQRSVNELLDNIKGPSSAILDIMNMKYMLSKWEIKDAKYKLVKDGYVKIYENTNCLQRFYFARQAVFCDKKDIITNILDGKANLANTVFIENNIANTSESSPNAPGKYLSGIIVNQYGLNKADITTNTDQGSWLVYSESYYPGWQAAIDDMQVVIQKANYNFMAVFVPAGKHRILFKYRPRFFKMTAFISIISLFAAFMYLILGNDIILRKQGISRVQL